MGVVASIKWKSWLCHYFPYFCQWASIVMIIDKLYHKLLFIVMASVPHFVCLMIGNKLDPEKLGSLWEEWVWGACCDSIFKFCAYFCTQEYTRTCGRCMATITCFFLYSAYPHCRNSTSGNFNWYKFHIIQHVWWCVKIKSSELFLGMCVLYTVSHGLWCLSTDSEGISAVNHVPSLKNLNSNTRFDERVWHRWVYF